jgi:hypothetical protein
MLWLEKNMPDAADDSVVNQAVLKTGNDVGDLAMGYYGSYTEVPYQDDKSNMIDETKMLIDRGTEIIAEASFSYDGNFCAVDLLRFTKEGAEIIEVKSSTGLKPIYYHDMAYQYFVLSSCGLNVTKVSLMHINREYVRQGNLDIQQLFTLEDCTTKVCSMKDEVQENSASFKAVLSQETEPGCDIGLHCNDPYECTFKGHCWKHIGEYSVFNIARMNWVKKFDLYYRGIISFADILKSDTKLNEKMRRQLEAEVNGTGPFINHSKIEDFLNQLSFPLYFLDFETFQQAIPGYDGLRPYMHIPFQYSLHYMDKRGGTLQHCEFLAKEGTDPRRSLAECLCKDIPSSVCVLAYNSSFEKRVIKSLGELYPDLQEHLMGIHKNIKDLMKPFQGHDYYCREFYGSYSIKYVLPALYPNDPELDYHSLGEIQNGSDAMNAFPDLSSKTPEEIEKIRKALLSYCRLDTLAMVKICEFLWKLR